LVEHQLWELAVAGSNPVAPTIFCSSSFHLFILRVTRIFQICLLAKFLFRGQKETEEPATFAVPNF
jgi:hypothetical protein